MQNLFYLSRLLGKRFNTEVFLWGTLNDWFEKYTALSIDYIASVLGAIRIIYFKVVNSFSNPSVGNRNARFHLMKLDYHHHLI